MRSDVELREVDEDPLEGMRKDARKRETKGGKRRTSRDGRRMVGQLGKNESRLKKADDMLESRRFYCVHGGRRRQCW